MHIPKMDRILLLALFLSLAFCMYGIHWGWVECWNADQMAFQNIGGEGRWPLQPYTYQKPPFHTYFNFFLSVIPVKVIGKLTNLSPKLLTSVQIFWSRALTFFLFLGAVILVFNITKKFFGLFAARIVTIIFSTSAGLITESHYLTADIPVLFWMLLAFYFAQNISLNRKFLDYVGAGFFTGIATATKYNGLSIGIAIVVAHILSVHSISWQKLILDRKLFISLALVPTGFLIGNPFALLDYYNFTSDFLYNYIVTPVYDGSASTKHGYGNFLLYFAENIGFPSLIVFTVALLFSIYFLFTAEKKIFEVKGILLTFSFILLYYYKFGSFPRLEARFVTPIVPFWLIVSGPFWNKIKPNTMFVAGLLTILISYNLVCSFYVGKRFAEDPRMQAQEWVKKNIPEGSSIESSQYTPKWNLLPGVNLQDERMPSVSGRRKRFEQMFSSDSWVIKEVKKREEDTTKTRWYLLKELMKRQPDYIAVNSKQYSRFFKNETASLYPSIKEFYSKLLNEEYPYKIVFDRASQSVSKWLYPQQLSFVDNRITILKKIEKM